MNEKQTQIRGGFVYSCSCGINIMIVPDVAEMDLSIEHHLVEHKNLTGTEITEDYLCEQIFKVILLKLNNK